MYLDIARNDIPGGIVELILKGVLDANTFEKLDNVIFELLDSGQCKHLLIDMTGVSGLSSAGAGALLSVSEQALTAGGGVVLFNVLPAVLKTLHILGLVESDGHFHPHKLAVVEARPVALALLGMKQEVRYYQSEKPSAEDETSGA